MLGEATKQSQVLPSGPVSTASGTLFQAGFSLQSFIRPKSSMTLGGTGIAVPGAKGTML